MAKSVLAALVILLLCPGLAWSAQAQNTVTRESTVVATVHRIERSSRVVTLRGDGGVVQDIYVEPAIKEFDDLRVGDVVTVRYVESAVVKVRPEAKLSDARDTTEEARKAGRADVVTQVTAVVTIESIDSDGLFVKYRTKDNMLAVRGVNDKRVLEGLHPGDRVEVTLTRERAVSIQRGR